MQQKLSNTRIAGVTILPSPLEIQQAIPMIPRGMTTVFDSRRRMTDIIHGRDKKGFLLIGGPCCADQQEPVLKFMSEFASWSRHQHVLRIGRACVVKPRTDPRDYKGPLFDHEMNGQSDLSDALAYCREMLVGIVNMGMPIGLELLDQVGLPHLADLVTFGWLGARDCLGNVSPSLLSGFSGVGGIKNPLNGDIKGAVDAMVKASLPQDFFGISQESGTCARLQTLGNGDVVLILRGTDKGPNYYQYSVEQAIEVLDSKGFTDIGVVIDVSHGNSGKDASKQFGIVKEVLAWRPVSRVGHRVVGVMVEAYLLPGKQSVPQDRNGFHVSQVTPGQSVVDDCMGIDEFKELYEYVCRAIPH